MKIVTKTGWWSLFWTRCTFSCYVKRERRLRAVDDGVKMLRICSCGNWSLLVVFIIN